MECAVTLSLDCASATATMPIDTNAMRRREAPAMCVRDMPYLAR